jgi:hypothetical protein
MMKNEDTADLLNNDLHAVILGYESKGMPVDSNILSFFATAHVPNAQYVSSKISIRYCRIIL